MRWSWLVVVAMVSPVAAETISVNVPPVEAVAHATPSIRLAHPGAQVMIERAAFALRVEDRQITGTLTLALTATYGEQDTPFSIQVPSGTRFTSLAITGPSAQRGRKPERLVGKAVAADVARADYQSIVEGRRDPALLQWKGKTAHHDQLELRVFPLGMYSPALVELGIVLPRVTSLVIDPDEQLIKRLEVTVQGGAPQIWNDVRDPRTIALARSEAPFTLSAGPRTLVTATTSLFAGNLPDLSRRPVPTVVYSSHCGSSFSIDKRMIKQMVLDHHPQLRRCYMQVAQRSPSLAAGTANLHFRIDRDGTVNEVSVDGDLQHAEITECLAREVASWKFTTGGDLAVHVNYPLHFRANRAITE